MDIDELATFKEIDVLKKDTFHRDVNVKLVENGLVFLAWGSDKNHFIFVSSTNITILKQHQVNPIVKNTDSDPLCTRREF